MDLQKLKIDKLIKELDYIKSEISYKKAIIKDADIEFLNIVNEYLNLYPDLKKVYDDNLKIKTEELKINNTNAGSTEELSIEKEEDIEVKLHPLNDEIKKTYRDIVKVTHPDKVNNKRLNNMYLDATSHYKNNDLTSLYSICDKLGIDYDIKDDFESILTNDLTTLKSSISFMESSLSLKWKVESDQNIKDLLILSYIRSIIL